MEALKGYFSEIEIIGLLGAGGMGAVYKARQPRLDRFVALKVLSCPPQMRADFALRFEREAQVMAKLNHPNLITVHDFGEIGSEMTGDESLFYFLMEFVDGPDLGRLIRAGSLSAEQAISLVSQICDALQFAHDAGIVHRDIKPANILIDQKGMVKIADFGLATILDENNERFTTGLTMTGTSMGTPIYMAPEIWETPEEIDHRADIYSLGVVFYEMLTGERPAGVFDPPSAHAQVDPRIDRLVIKALNKKPDRRFQSAAELKADLARVTEPRHGILHRRSGRIMAVVAILGLAFGGFRSLEKLTGKAREEGKTATLEVEPPTALKPRPIETSPGRLKVVGHWKPWGAEHETQPFDLSVASAYDDFVQVVVKPNSGIFFALRANGELISNQEGFQPLGGIHRLGQYSVEYDSLVVIDRKGAAFFLPPDESRASEELSGVDRPVIDVALWEGNGLLLLDDGRAIPWGKIYHDGDFVKRSQIGETPMPRPEAADLTGVTAIAVGDRHTAVLKADGSVQAWGVEGRMSLPIEMSEGIREIDLSVWNSVFSVDTRDRLRVSNQDGTLNSTIYGEGVARVVTKDINQGSYYQTKDGTWHFFDFGFANNHTEISQAMPFIKGSPPEAFHLSASGSPNGEAFLLWIEPR